jgi:hypothetical protein
MRHWQQSRPSPAHKQAVPGTHQCATITRSRQKRKQAEGMVGRREGRYKRQQRAEAPEQSLTATMVQGTAGIPSACATARCHAGTCTKRSGEGEGGGASYFPPRGLPPWASLCRRSVPWCTPGHGTGPGTWSRWRGGSHPAPCSWGPWGPGAEPQVHSARVPPWASHHQHATLTTAGTWRHALQRQYTRLHCRSSTPHTTKATLLQHTAQN